MTMTNSVTLLGHLGSAVEVRKTSGGSSVCNFRLATNETWVSNGQKQKHTEWHRVVIFGKLADTCGEYLASGSQVLLTGKLRTRKWTDKDGTDRYTTEIHANQVQFLARAKSKTEQGEVAEEVAAPVQEEQLALVSDDSVPF